jgi:hypothetical protein
MRKSKPRLTLFKHSKVDAQTLERIYWEAWEEIAVLDRLESLGGKATVLGIARGSGMTQKVVQAALKRQAVAGNVRRSWERMRIYWELV